ncbi:PilZ domain-containing protein [Allosphingosinicella sp.]|jgi:hypothetical protein|uniref:PilZ domain-containing protein n=1 Tax=Allosphingosinicella sp. TaxID=2823234 RepID=UPI002EF320B1
MDRRPPFLRGGQSSGPHFRERESERLSVDGSTQLRHADWYSVEVKVRDVSTSGFMAECADAVEIGSHVSLDVPGIGPVQAQVRWQIGRRMGGMFLDPISLTRCEWMATRADSHAVEA